MTGRLGQSHGVAGTDFSVTLATSWHEVARRKAQGCRDSKEVTELEIVLAQLCPLHRRTIHLGAMRQFLLSHFDPHPGVTNPQAYPPAGIKDPVGLI